MDGSSDEQFVQALKAQFTRRFQHYLDKTKTYILYRWLALAGILTLYALRVWALNGFYVVTYGLGIFLLNLFIGFITPQSDTDADGPLLPQKADEESKGFQRKVLEFTFWYNATKAVLIAFCMTFVGLFDFPVFWPILLLYFLALFALTMRQQIANMIKYKYVPFTWGKARYDRARGKGKDAAPVAVPPAEPLFRGANLR